MEQGKERTSNLYGTRVVSVVYMLTNSHIHTYCIEQGKELIYDLYIARVVSVVCIHTHTHTHTFISSRARS